MKPLAARILAEIEKSGPLTLERFWNLALFDPREGYYTSRTSIGREGDFVTAPEISQMFGELIGAWLVSAWRGLGRPDPFVLAEIGPGHGTLMADLVRTARALDPAFMRAARVRLIETSDRLAAIQAERLARFDLPLPRTRRLSDIEALPLLLVANELFDAVAIRQFAFAEKGWRERLVGARDGGLAFVDGLPINLPEARLPAPPRPGEIMEFSPAREAIAHEIGTRLRAHGGAALLIDYGHARSAYGDTLQALRAHRFAEVLEHPGEQDITSHVDFARLSAAFSHAGAIVSPVMRQGAFLLSLGLAERAGILGRDRDATGRAEIEAAARRLAGDGEGQMGALFKILAAASIPLPLPPFPAS